MTEVKKTPKWQIIVEDVTTAFDGLTSIPIRLGVEPEIKPDINRSQWVFPLVGLVVAAFGSLTLALSSIIGVSLTSGIFLCLLVMAMTTSAIHETGLANAVNAFNNGKTSEDKREMMQKGSIGGVGAVALILLFGVKASSMIEVSTSMCIAAIASAAILSRLMIVVVLFFLSPSQRLEEINEKSKPEPDVLTKTTPGRLFVALVLGLGTIIMLSDPIEAMLMFAVACSTAFTVGWYSISQVDHHTFDTIGLVQQSSELAVLVLLSVIWSIG